MRISNGSLRGGARRLPSFWIFAFVAALGATLAWAPPGSSFESDDGNLIADLGGTDWESFVGSSALKIGQDLPTGQNDDSLSGKEDDPVPDVTYGSIPNNKSDLQRFYVVHESVDVGGELNDLLYVAWTRANTLGSANMDFEFNQSNALTPNGLTPVRTPGDMLISFSFANGGETAVLGLSRWTEDPNGPCEAENEGPCWGPLMPLNGSVADGAVNFVPVFDPIEGITKPEKTFGEAAINLTAAGVFDREVCTTFGKAFIKSRSSSSFTSQMKDTISPIDVSVTNCATITIRKDAVPDGSAPFTFVPSPEIHPSAFDLDDDGDDNNALPSFREFEARLDGTYTVVEQPREGWDLTDVTCSGNATPVQDVDGNFTGRVGDSIRVF